MATLRAALLASQALLAGKPEAFAVIDGKRTQATPCAFPSFPARSEEQAETHVGCHVGACDERRGFEGQLGTILLLKGCPMDNEAAALFRMPHALELDFSLDSQTNQPACMPHLLAAP